MSKQRGAKGRIPPDGDGRKLWTEALRSARTWPILGRQGQVGHMDNGSTVGAEILQELGGSGTTQGGAECMDSGSDCLGPNPGFAPHLSEIWSKSGSLW